MMIPRSHPRKKSLEQRHRVVEGLKKGFVAHAGLIAHGRGEAFDYLIGEETTKNAMQAEKAAAAMLFLAEKPVISVNGNTAALVPAELVKLADAARAKLEVNLFYRTLEREKLIKKVLEDNGAKMVYGVGDRRRRVPGLYSERSRIDEAIAEADVVLVCLEDGDRTEKLVELGKRVVAVDLNPLSRTARNAHVTVVDNVVRAVPKINEYLLEFRRTGKRRAESVLRRFDNRRNLIEAEHLIRAGFRRSKYA